MPDPIDAHSLMATLRAQLELLNTVVQQCVTTAVVFDIPRYTDGQVPDEIVPRTITGEKAVTLATDGFRNLSRPIDQHPGSVWRVPGVICVDKDLTSTVEKINSVKTELKAFVQTRHPNARARNTFYRKEFPGRVMLQVYRRIYVNRNPIEKVRFTWSPFTEAKINLSRQEALNLLSKRRESRFDHTNKNRFIALEMAYEHVQDSPKNTLYTIKKPRSPYPVGTIYEVTAGGIKPKSMQLSLPLIIGPQSVEDIGKLTTFNQLNRRRTRSDKLATELVYKPLYLYRRHDVSATAS